jgi:hypothetical protein
VINFKRLEVDDEGEEEQARPRRNRGPQKLWRVISEVLKGQANKHCRVSPNLPPGLPRGTNQVPFKKSICSRMLP